MKKVEKKTWKSPLLLNLVGKETNTGSVSATESAHTTGTGTGMGFS